MAKNKLKAKLTETIKKMLGERASQELLKAINPELMKELSLGKTVPTVAELLVDKVVKLALDPKKSNQWAVELIFERVEGKAVKGIAIREEGRLIEDRLNEITTEHLNSLAAQFAKEAASELAGRAAEVEDTPTGPASKLLDLSKDRTGDTEEARREPALAE